MAYLYRMAPVGVRGDGGGGGLEAIDPASAEATTCAIDFYRWKIAQRAREM